MTHLKRLLPIAIATLASAAFADGFSGWQTSIGLEKAASTLKGGEYTVLSTGQDASYSAADGKKSGTGLKLGIGYGIDHEKYLTTVGIDYSTASNSISNSVVTGAPTAIGPNGIHVKNRLDLHIAPGYKFNSDTVGYVKLGYSQSLKDSLMDTGTGASIGSGPSSNGILYGIGFKQKLEPKQPYFYSVDYTFGSTGKGTIIDPLTTANGYQAKLNFSSLSFNIGYVY
jgi:hypothetical protein